MVVGANVEDGMILAIVPFYQLVVLAYEREEAAATGTSLLLVALLNLCQQPTARDDGVCLEQFEARCGTHLARYDALQIRLHGQFVDSTYAVGVYHEAQRAQEGLRLLTLPVEVDADCYVVQ